MIISARQIKSYVSGGRYWSIALQSNKSSQRQICTTGLSSAFLSLLWWMYLHQFFLTLEKVYFQIRLISAANDPFIKVHKSRFHQYIWWGLRHGSTYRSFNLNMKRPIVKDRQSWCRIFPQEIIRFIWWQRLTHHAMRSWLNRYLHDVKLRQCDLSNGHHKKLISPSFGPIPDKNTHKW